MGVAIFGPQPTQQVATALMVHRWEHIAFLHWRYPAEAVQRLLPAGLRVQTYDGSAWVGLAPFRMRISRPPVPELPWVGVFPETNVRTYVDDPRGGKAVWFFSLDAARLAPVLVARAVYGLPYCWSTMAISRDGDRWDYDSERRWPGPSGARCHVGIAVGDAYDPSELHELDHFLTARFVLINQAPWGLARSPAHHHPWPLHRATLTRLDTDLPEAAGLPTPAGDPLVHWSPGVRVRIGAPERI